MIYYYHDLRTPLFLIMVYAKAQREDMTPDQKKQVGALAAALKPSSPRKGWIMAEFADDLIQGMKEAVAYTRGKTAGSVVHVIDVPDVRAIRRSLHMSQQRFAETYRIPLPTLKNWEQGRRIPDAPAAAYLKAISRSPQAVKEALQAA